MLFRSLIRLLIKASVILFVGVMIAVSLGYYYFMHTTWGAKWCFDRFAYNYLGAKVVKYRDFEGNINKGVRVLNVRIEDVNKFTTRSLMLVQQLDFKLPGLDLRKMQIKFRNGRIKFPLSDPLGFYGTVIGKELKLNLYCGILDVREIVSVIKSDLSLHNMEGTARKAQMTIAGTYEQPQLKGDFFLEDFRYLGFSLAMLPAQFHYQLQMKNRDLLWIGELLVPSGEIVSRKTRIELSPSRLIFDGPFRNPKLEIYGSAKVDQTQINLTLGGTKQKPVLNVTSNPPKPKNILLVMLATGQELIVAHDSIGQEDFSFRSDNDFVDFFTFSSQGGSTDAVGITDFSFNMQDNEKWLGIKKRVNDQLKVGINLQETRTVSGQNVDVTRTVGGEVQVSDHITVGVDKKVTEVQDPAESKSTLQEKDGGMDVMIKYKKNF